MADEIVSSLGFTVEDALVALTKLDTMFQSTFNSMASVLTNWNSKAESTVMAINNIATAAQNAKSAIAGLKVPATAGKTPTAAAGAVVGANVEGTAAKIKTVTGATEEANKATQSWVISWKTMGRVVVTQMIVRALSEVRNALGEAIQGAVEFQTRIAEIQTIAPKLDQNFSALGEEVARFASRFNFPLPQAAEAVYQSLSNQFTTAAQRADIMKAAAELAKVGVMSLSDAVLLITGTLNAYGQSSSQAESVASKFFTTISMGRVRGEELVAVVGKLYPMAAALGVSLESANSELIGLTIGGMKSTEASTALRGAMTALLKPSEALKAELKSLGYETGPQIISALGLQGAFLKLGESADGDVQKLATMFRQVRGLNAELRLTGPGATAAAEAFDALSKSTADTVRGVYEQFRSTEAHKFTDALNQIKIYLATELGPALLSAFNAIAKFSGGADTLKAAFTGLLVAGVPIVLGLGAIAVALLAVSANARLAETSVRGLTKMLSMALLPIAAIGTIAFVNEKTAAGLRTSYAEIDKLIEASAAKRQDAIDAENKAIKDQTDAQLSELEKRAAAARKSYTDMVADTHEANEAIKSNDKATMESMIADVQRLAGVYRSQANTEIQESRKAVAGKIAAELEYSNAVFDFAEKHKSAWDKVMDYSRKARIEGGKAVQAGAAAKSPEQHAEALALMANAQAMNEKAVSAAGNNSYLEEEAERTKVGLIKQKGQMQADYAKTSLKVSQASSKAAAEEQTHANRMKAIMPELVKDMDLFKKGAPKSTEERAANIEKTRKDMAAFQKEWAASGQISTSSLLNWTEFKEKLTATMEGGVSDVEIKGFLATPDSLKALNEQISQGIGPINILIKEMAAKNPEFAKKAAGKTAPEALNLGLEMTKAGVKSAADFKEKTDSIKNSEGAIRDQQAGMITDIITYEETFSGVVGKIRTVGGALSEVASDFIHWMKPQSVAAEWSDAYNKITDMAKKPSLVTKQSVASLEAEITDLKNLSVLPTSKTDFLDAMLVKIKAIQAIK
jgi:TP901 family phage tail tape measure protein